MGAGLSRKKVKIFRLLRYCATFRFCLKKETLAQKFYDRRKLEKEMYQSRILQITFFSSIFLRFSSGFRCKRNQGEEMPFVMEEVSRGWRPLRVVPEFVFSSFLFFLAEFFFFTFPGRKNVNRRVAFSLSLSLFHFLACRPQ